MTSALAKIKWSCRRGMKELDLVLLPFVDATFAGLNPQQRADLAQLLALDDRVLFDSLFNQQTLVNPDLQALINLLKSYHQHHVANGTGQLG